MDLSAHTALGGFLIRLHGRLWRGWGICLGLAAALACPPAKTLAASVVTTQEVRAELLVHAPQGLRPNAPAWLGLKIVHQPGWHTYWLNPGDSGLPTQLQWQLPEGLRAGEIQWPVPHRLPIGPLVNHGYEGTLLLTVPLAISRPLPEGPVAIGLRADWLVCKDVCIPQGADLTLRLQDPARRPAWVESESLFEETRSRLPRPWPTAQASAQVDGAGLTLKLQGLPAAWQGRRLEIFPVQAHLLSPSVEPRASWANAPAGAWVGLMADSPQRMESPSRLDLVVSAPKAEGEGLAPTAPDDPPGILLTASVAGSWPPPGATTPIGPGGASPVDSTDPTSGGTLEPGASWWLAALLAALGGLVLNLMPCVFPVLSLKVFGFASQAHDRRALAVAGLSYTAGVVLSFAALAALLLALRASGEQLGWGFQLQSPAFVAALALLFALLGLNLLGHFEFGMMVPGAWAGARARSPVVDHFLTGVLAVAVASPCTAPFMGASVGAAMTMPAAKALGVFTALGLGMALPYLLLSLLPGWAARLPRPGPWMLRVRHAMALPMLATVVWLLWVLGHQAGVDAAAGVLGFLLVVAFAIGAWQWRLEGAARGITRLLAGLAVLGGMAWSVPPLLDQDSGRRAADSGGAALLEPGSGRPGDWAAWSPQAMQRELAGGRTVFVDYTAAWCVTCQVNKRSTLRREEVVGALRERGIVTMQADWTRRDETITRELARLGRSGVPVYAFYRAGAEPILLPEVLTPGLVLDAVARLP